MVAAITHIHVERPEGVTKREHGRIMRDGLGKIGNDHVQKTLGKHFKVVPETQPSGPYGYVKRNRKYVEYKRRKFGNDMPLVRTGKLRRFIRNNAKVRKTQDRVTIQLKSYFPLTSQRRKELEAITEQEQRDMQALLIDYYEGEVVKLLNSKKKRKRV